MCVTYFSIKLEKKVFVLSSLYEGPFPKFSLTLSILAFLFFIFTNTIGENVFKLKNFNPHLRTFSSLLLERKEGERKTSMWERSTDWQLPTQARTWNWTHNLLVMTLQQTKPHQPVLKLKIFYWKIVFLNFYYFSVL